MRWFLCIALRILNAHDFRISALRCAPARTKCKRFPWSWTRQRNKYLFSLKRARWPFLIHEIKLLKVIYNKVSIWRKVDSFCYSGKIQLGIGLFMHELAQGALDLLHFSDTHKMIINWMKVNWEFFSIIIFVWNHLKPFRSKRPAIIGHSKGFHFLKPSSVSFNIAK